MKQAAFINTHAIEIGGKQPGATFFLPVFDDGTPTEMYWRRRIAENIISPETSASLVASDEAKTSKKGK